MKHVIPIMTAFTLAILPAFAYKPDILKHAEESKGITIEAPAPHMPKTEHIKPVVERKELLPSVTVYHPVPWQTDDSPCMAGGVDVCRMKKQGHKPLAVSQDLCGWAGCGSAWYGKGDIQKGDVVILKNERPECSGWFVVVDAMNERFTKKADMFWWQSEGATTCHNTEMVYTDRNIWK